MKKKHVWLVFGSLVSLVFVVASCSTASVSSPTTAAPTTSMATAAPVPTTAKSAAAETPQYGGVINVLSPMNINIFDEVIGWPAPAVTMQLTNQKLVQGDWAKGPAGTNVADWIQYVDVWPNDTGYVADSWQITGPGTITYTIRQDVHWALNSNSDASRLVNGREMTADDVAFSLKMYCSDPRAYLYRSSDVQAGANNRTRQMDGGR